MTMSFGTLLYTLLLAFGLLSGSEHLIAASDVTFQFGTEQLECAEESLFDSYLLVRFEGLVQNLEDGFEMLLLRQLDKAYEHLAGAICDPCGRRIVGNVTVFYSPVDEGPTSAQRVRHLQSNPNCSFAPLNSQQEFEEACVDLPDFVRDFVIIQYQVATSSIGSITSLGCDTAFDSNMDNLNPNDPSLFTSTCDSFFDGNMTCCCAVNPNTNEVFPPDRTQEITLPDYTDELADETELPIAEMLELTDIPEDECSPGNASGTLEEVTFYIRRDFFFGENGLTDDEVRNFYLLFISVYNQLALENCYPGFFETVSAYPYAQSDAPSMQPSESPSDSPTSSPSAAPTESSAPSALPSATPTLSAHPSAVPSGTPTMSSRPSSLPSIMPSNSAGPSVTPSDAPTRSSGPSPMPTSGPSKTTAPSEAPSESDAPTQSDAPSGSPIELPESRRNLRNGQSKLGGRELYSHTNDERRLFFFEYQDTEVRGGRQGVPSQQRRRFLQDDVDPETKMSRHLQLARQLQALSSSGTNLLANSCLCLITYDPETGEPQKGNGMPPSLEDLTFRFNAALVQARQEFQIPYGGVEAIVQDTPSDLLVVPPFNFNGIFPNFDFVYIFDTIFG